MKRSALSVLTVVTLLAFGGNIAMAQETEAEAEELALAAAYEATNPQPVTVWAAEEPIGDRKTKATVYFSDFEGTDGGAVGTLDWEWGTYSWSGAGCGSTPAPPVGPYSGTDMWGTVLNDCYTNIGNNGGYDSGGNCNSTDPSDDSILTFTVDLTGLSEAWLYWWEWYDLYSYFDWAEVRVNGTVVFQHCESSYVPSTAWAEQEVDISAFTGGVATIAFHMMASTVVDRAGWFIDDVLVSDVQIPVELQRFTID